MNIGLINLTKIDNDELEEKLKMINVELGYLSDITFCPYLICYNKDEFIINNINVGFLKSIKKEHNIIECDDIIDFINITRKIKNNTILQNQLF